MPVNSIRITVIGVGQTLRGDDAAGIEAVRRWEQAYTESASRPNVRVQYSELPGLSLLDLLEGFNVAVIVDAVEGMSHPGRVHKLGLHELESFPSGAKSAHGWGVAETLKLGQQLGMIPPQCRIRLVGIEAEQIGMGSPLSPAVEQALPAACEAIETEVKQALS